MPKTLDETFRLMPADAGEGDRKKVKLPRAATAREALMPLTPQEQRFANAIAAGDDLETAAKKAKCRSADPIAWAEKMMQRPHVQHAIGQGAASAPDPSKPVPKEWIRKKYLQLVGDPLTGDKTIAQGLKNLSDLEGYTKEGGAGQFSLVFVMQGPNGENIPLVSATPPMREIAQDNQDK